MKKAFWKNLALSAIGVGTLALVWLIAWISVGNEFIVPNLFLCLKKAVLLLFDKVFWAAALFTLKRVLIAFCISAVLALVLAVVAYLYPSFEKIVAPIAGVLRATPILGVLLIILVLTEKSSVTTVIVAFLSLFPMLYAEMLSAFKGVDKDLIEMSKVYQVPLKRQITALYLPSVLPQILRQGGAAIGFGVKLVVSAEVLAHTANGLGVLMQDMQIFDEIPTMYALIILSCALAFAFETAFTALARLAERRGK